MHHNNLFSVGINGRLLGYFRGSRGIRQGYPLSPYLFGIVMNVLSKKLYDAATNGRFSYHPNCQQSGLTCLCFPDGMLIFSDGSTSSIQGILVVLQEFKQLSNLAVSAEKSCFFSSGLTKEKRIKSKISLAFLLVLCQSAILGTHSAQINCHNQL